MTPTEHTPKSPAAKTGFFAPLSHLLGAKGTGAPSVKLIALVATAALLALTATPASAEVTHSFQFSFDGSETPAKSFGGARGVAVDASSGDVYVVDLANNVVDKFKPNGEYLSQITGATTTAGSFSFQESAPIAVDNSQSASAGDVYVADAGHGVIDKFDSSGAFLGQVGGSFAGALNGVAVDALGNLWVHDKSGKVSEFDPGGNAAGAFSSGFGEVNGFGVDSNSNTYFREAKFNSAGQSLGVVDECFFCQEAIATDLSTDEVYFYDRHTETSGPPRVVEYGPAKELLATFGQAQLASGGHGGMAVNLITGTIYVANAADAKVYAFAANPGPRVSAPVPSEVKAVGFKVKATVNPEGAQLTECRFEYGTDTLYGQSVPCAESPATIGSGTEPVEVHAALQGLTPGTTYHFRLAVANPAGSAKSADRHVATLPAPTIDEAKAIEVQPTSATLTAKVNPKGSATTYRFEYGTDTSYGTEVPPGGEAIGNATSDQEVSQHIEELTEDTTYHWRIVAVNHCNPAEPAEECTTVSPDHTFVFLPPPPHEACPENESFRTGPSAPLPDCRAYEQVTPTHKNGALMGDDFAFGPPPLVSAVGSRVTSWALQCFAAAQSCNANHEGTIGSPFAFNRTAAGWQPTALLPPAPPLGGVAALYANADTGTALAGVSTPPGGQYDWIVRRADGSFLDLGPATPPAAGPQGIPHNGSEATADYSHFVWEDERATWPFDATTGNRSVYEYVGAGHTGEGSDLPFLVGVSGGPLSTDLISVCGTFLAGPGALSADGHTVYFRAARCSGGSGANAATAVPAEELYARVDGEQGDAHTVLISGRSPGQCSGECLSSPPGDANFEGVSTDGSVAYFTSTQQLTDSATQDPSSADTAANNGCRHTSGPNGCNLYLHDFNRPAGEELVDVSAGDTSGAGPRVQGVMAISPDASHAYFVAKGVLTGENAEHKSPTAGANNLYLYEPDPANPGQQRTVFIATLPGSDVGAWTEHGTPEAAISPNLTPDGRFLLFASHAALTPDDTSASGATQVFRYDASTQALLRVSIGQRGFNDNGNRSAPTPCKAGSGHCSEDAHIVPTIASNHSNPSISDNGAYAFFTSPVGLTPGALDDVRIATAEGGAPIYAQNVYEWEAQGVGGCEQASGCVRLISDGRDTTANHGQAAACGGIFAQSSVCLLGTDASGHNVFFSTADSLLPSDTDTQLDYYDARSGGGFAEPPPTEICETSDACHGKGSEEGSSPAPATPGFNGPEEGAKHPVHPKKAHHKHKKKHGKKKSHKRAGANRGGKQ